MKHLTPKPTTANGWAFARLGGTAWVRTKTFFTQPRDLISSPGHALRKTGPESSILTANWSPLMTREMKG